MNNIVQRYKSRNYQISRLVPDIRPARYTAFLGILDPAGYPVLFVGYQISSSSIHKIVNIVNNEHYFSI